MGRCWWCCQENCAYTSCSCSCHRGDERRSLNDTFKEVELEKCPKCHHPLAFHRDHEGDSGARYGSSHYCDERESYDNNDFCGCTHGAPPKKEFVFYAIASDDNLEKAKWYCTYSAQKPRGWKSDINDAKVWVRRSAAKSKATALGPQARLVEFHVTKTVVIDQRAEAMTRVIDNLRRHVSGKWKYVYEGGSEWRHESGLTVRAEAHFAPRFDGDDDNFEIRYRRTDTGERVYPFLGLGLPTQEKRSTDR